MYFCCSFIRFKITEMLNELVVFEKRGKKLFLKNKCIPIYNMVFIPITYLPRL